MTRVSEAVILMAGQGSRLRGADKTFLKPFVQVLGKPLISYTLQALTSKGINRLHFVVGYESERMIAETKRLISPGTTASFIKNHQWQKQNGISLLAAAGHVRTPFFLAMSDHLFDDAVIDRLFDQFDPRLLNIAIDRKLDCIFDLHDAMKVRTRKDSVVEIGKNLRDYDAIDVGMFVCPVEIFAYLNKAKSASAQSDCSFADAIRVMAADTKTRVIDVGDAWWQDVDTPGALLSAEKNLTALIRS
jgi:choline kinase